ncbi:MAG: hypothetical protein LUH21_04115 [Clostridiales bacterium]|nr:hypothetical protein [Clostridiales bacterium]
MNDEDLKTISDMIDEKMKPVNDRLLSVEKEINVIAHLMDLSSRIEEVKKQVSELERVVE